ncbi:NAD(P)-dependent oxidoreductase [uncultured Cohaesibacter sp.]|uniref:NAD(P)-dependent oxidoreductase n=1 Tax=uncultured Cohaesibacter sp. TaxID=1002546 RepID=UPI0029C66280|nr:NAD(P)-dependent oxidoreductase [uncultured Cohaesibacter sp.]
MKRVLLVSELEDDQKDYLSEHYDLLSAGAAIGEGDELSEGALTDLMASHQPHILIVNSSPTTAKVLDASANLEMVICARGTPNNVDVEHCRQKGLLLCNTPSRNANAVAEFTIGLMFTTTRQIPQSMEAIKNRTVVLEGDPEEEGGKDVIWIQKDLPFIPYERYCSMELASATLGLVGLGFIGGLVAEKAKALGMDVLVYDPYQDKEALARKGYELVEFQELTANADVISLHAKETAETRHIIDAKAFAAMKPSAYLINTARGSLVDYAALMDALKSGRIAGAAVDVFPYEPLRTNDPIIDTPNLTMTPHIAGASRNVVKHHSRMVMQSIRDFENGETPKFMVR